MRKLKLEELERLSEDEFRRSPKIPVVIVLDNIRSAMNVGSIFRTCDALAIQSIYLCGITARPPHREILKTAIGASQTVAWKYFKETPSAVMDLKNTGYTVVGVEQTSQSVAINNFDVNTQKKYAVIFGNEVTGIGESLLPMLDVALEIPQFGTKHSLNVSVCAGIVLWHIAKPFLIS